MLSGELPCRRPFSRCRAGWHLASYASFEEASCSAGGAGRTSAPTRTTARRRALQADDGDDVAQGVASVRFKHGVRPATEVAPEFLLLGGHRQSIDAECDRPGHRCRAQTIVVDSRWFDSGRSRPLRGRFFPSRGARHDRVRTLARLPVELALRDVPRFRSTSPWCPKRRDQVSAARLVVARRPTTVPPVPPPCPLVRPLVPFPGRSRSPVLPILLFHSFASTGGREEYCTVWACSASIDRIHRPVACGGRWDAQPASSAGVATPAAPRPGTGRFGGDLSIRSPTHWDGILADGTPSPLQWDWLTWKRTSPWDS